MIREDRGALVGSSVLLLCATMGLAMEPLILVLFVSDGACRAGVCH